MSNNFSVPLVKRLWILRWFFSVVLLEIFLGGNGHLLEINDFLTIRMVFFCIYIAASLFFLIKYKAIKKTFLNIFLVYIYFILFAAFIGFFNSKNINASAIFEDIKPLLSFSIILFLGYTINSYKDIGYVIKLLKIASICLVILHIALIIFYKLYLHSDFSTFWQMLNTDDYINYGQDSGKFPTFLFKGEDGLVNYIGDIYLCIGFIVWDHTLQNGRKKLLVLSLIALAIILTGTRGFIVSLILLYLVKWFFLKVNLKAAFFLLGITLVFIPIYLIFKQGIGDKNESDVTRYIQVAQVVDQITPTSFFLGHGFGHGVPIRPIHMELSLIEVFHKQGIIGLFFWGYLIYLAYHLYKKNNTNISLMFFLSIVLVYIISFTNPYMNHPLGLTMIALALSCLFLLEKKNQQLNV